MARVVHAGERRTLGGVDINEALLDEIEDRFRKVLVGEISRWDAHLWAEAMMFADSDEPFAAPVGSGLQALHGLTVVEITPGRVAHLEHPGPMRSWAVTDAQAHARFADFMEAATAWRDSPERYLEQLAQPSVESMLLVEEIDDIERNMTDEDGDG